jgi:hypothetical protein
MVYRLHRLVISLFDYKKINNGKRIETSLPKIDHFDNVFTQFLSYLQNINDFLPPHMLTAMQNYYIQLSQQQSTTNGTNQSQHSHSSSSAAAAVQSAAAAILQAAAAKNVTSNSLGGSCPSPFGLSPSVTSASTLFGLANLMAAAKRSNSAASNGNQQFGNNGGELPAPKAVILGSPPPPLALTPQPTSNNINHHPSASQLSTPSMANNNNRPQTVTPSPGGAFRRSPMLNQLVIFGIGEIILEFIYLPLFPSSLQLIAV